MSTAAAWDTLPAQALVLPARAPVGRPRLVVIDGGAGRESARPTELPVPRWARLAVTLSVVAVLSMMLAGLGGASVAPAPVGSVEVRSGQTLSHIARAEMPGVAAAEAVARIQLANNLPSTHVTAGQVIVIPAY